MAARLGVSENVPLTAGPKSEPGPPLFDTTAAEKSRYGNGPANAGDIIATRIAPATTRPGVI